MSVNKVTVDYELDFPQTSTRQAEMCFFPKKEGKGAKSGSGKRSKRGYIEISLTQDVVLILGFPCSLYPAPKFIKGSRLNIQDVLVTWRPWLSLLRLSGERKQPQIEEQRQSSL